MFDQRLTNTNTPVKAYAKSWKINMVESNGGEIWPDNLSGTKYGLTVITISSVVFYFCGQVGDKITPKKAEKQRWRWKNIFVSLVHAIVSGIWAVCR